MTQIFFRYAFFFHKYEKSTKIPSLSALVGLELAAIAAVADDPDVLRRRRHPHHDGDAHDARSLSLYPLQHRARNTGRSLDLQVVADTWLRETLWLVGESGTSFKQPFRERFAPRS